MKNFIFFVSFFVINLLNAQSFSNPIFDGTPNFSGQGFSVFNDWERVPASDPVCLANMIDHTDTPDLTNENLGQSSGITGIPYSGEYFVAGLHISNGAFYFQEGVMQTVNNFIVGCQYTISLHQAVVKQDNCLDRSGSWAVYADNVLIGVTTPSFSNLAYNDINLTWDYRTVTFTATAQSHTIKFLPLDDDTDLMSSDTNIDGGLRMGIDLVEIVTQPSITLGPDLVGCEGDTIPLSVIPFLTDYIWSNGSTDSVNNITQSGNYWLTSTTGCAHSDTIYIEFTSPNPQIFEEGGNFSTSSYDTYQWIDCQTLFEIPNENGQNFNTNQIGDYAVVVSSNGCADTSECLPFYVIPSAFTPDGDLTNDFWEIPNLDDRFPKNVVYVYNRWGNLVFQSEAGKYNEVPWDGTFNGNILPVASYYYVIEPNDGVSEGLKGVVSIVI